MPWCGATVVPARVVQGRLAVLIRRRHAACAWGRQTPPPNGAVLGGRAWVGRQCECGRVRVERECECGRVRVGIVARFKVAVE